MRRFGNIRSCAFGALLVALLFGSAFSLQAGPITMTQVPSIAPNVYGSPSWNTYVTNALTALQTGATTQGAAGASQYNAVTGGTVSPGDVVVSGFQSWRGVAPGPYAGELGNRLDFGLKILGNGEVFRLSWLVNNMNSSDAANLFNNDGGFSSYNAYTVGRYYGDDKIRGTGDDVIYTAGGGNAWVNELLYVGVGNAIVADTGADNAAKLSNAMAYVAGMSVTNQYCLYDDIGDQLVCSDSQVNVAGEVIPEPATGLLLLAGVGALVAIRRFKRR